jgi:hypothetical protein
MISITAEGSKWQGVKILRRMATCQKISGFGVKR